MAHSKLVGLKITGISGFIERDIVVQEAIPVFQLHRVIQFCLGARGDEQAEAQPFTFKHGNTVIKATKSTQLYRADSKSNEGCAVGRTYSYQADNGLFTVRVTGVRDGDARYFVPRCTGGFGGNTDFDIVNKKLLVRRFTATGKGKGKKQLPKVWCDRRTPDSAIMESYLASMSEPLFPPPARFIFLPFPPAMLPQPASV